MSTVTLPNIRVSSDLTVGVVLKDGGVAIDWSTLSNIKAYLYADAQRAMAGRCTVSIDETDSTRLVCAYRANKPQYIGVNRIVITCTYRGETKTYDKPALNFVRWTDDQAGQQITIDDPDVDVEIEVEDVSSSLLDQAIAAALAAAAAAEHAAHLIPNQVLLDAEAATAAANAAADAANAAGITSAQVSIADDEPGTPSADVSLVNKVLSIIFHHLKGNTGDAAGFGTITATVDDVVGDPSVTVTASGPDTAKNFTFAFHGLRGIQGVPGVANAKYKQVDTLPTASAATMDFIYLTPSGTSGVYNMSYTEQDGSTYSWQDLGTTAIQLSDYATKAEVSQLEHEVDENAMISDSLAGLVFNDTIQHQKAKNAIKAIWFTYGPYISDAEKPLVDALRNNLISLSTEIQITYLYNVSGTYGCMLRIVDANNATCFQKYVAGIHTISGSEEVWDISVNANTVLYPNDSGISGYPFQLHIAIDWNALSGETITSAGDNPITIIFGDVAWGERVPTISVKDQIEYLSKSSIVGKTIVCFGDSLTEIVDTTYSKHYTDYLADMTGANFINVGIGGSNIRRRLSYDVGVFDSSKTYAINDFCIYTNGSNETRLYKFTSAHTGAWDDNDVILAPYQQNAYSLLDIYSLIKASCQQSFTDVVAACKVIKETQSDDNTAIINRLVAIDWSQVDAITIFAGTNDWYVANTLGTTGSNDANKTLGAINEIIRLFLTAYPQVKVYWFTPIVRWVSGFNVGTNPPTIDDTKFSDNYSVEGNGTLKDESAAIIQEATKNHIPVCDMYNNFGWNKYNCKLYFAGTDGTHPRTYAGVTYLAKKILNFILANNTL